MLPDRINFLSQRQRQDSLNQTVTDTTVQRFRVQKTAAGNKKAKADTFVLFTKTALI